MHSINSLSKSGKRPPSSSRELMAREEVPACTSPMEPGDGLIPLSNGRGVRGEGAKRTGQEMILGASCFGPNLKALEYQL